MKFHQSPPALHPPRRRCTRLEDRCTRLEDRVRMRQVVKPPATLYIVPSGPKQPGAFCKLHGLRTAYFNDVLFCRKTEHRHWQLLENVRWLCNVDTGEYVVVVGGPKYFLANVAAARDDMPAFNLRLRNFEQLLLAYAHKSLTDSPDPVPLTPILRSLPLRAGRV